MFTGIIETVGTIKSVRERSGAREFVIHAPEISSELKPGDSVTVDGACQTATRNDADSFTIEPIGTTLSRTVAGDYRVGSKVNLERSMILEALAMIEVTQTSDQRETTGNHVAPLPLE